MAEDQLAAARDDLWLVVFRLAGGEQFDWMPLALEESRAELEAANKAESRVDCGGTCSCGYVEERARLHAKLPHIKKLARRALDSVS